VAIANTLQLEVDRRHASAFFQLSYLKPVTPSTAALSSQHSLVHQTQRNEMEKNPNNLNAQKKT